MARVIAAVAALALLAGCGGQGGGAGDGQGDSKEPEAPLITGDPAGYNAADIAFASDMVPHHAQAIDLARTALERSANPELTALAEQIVSTQQPEINILNVFLVQWNENPENRSGPDGGGPESSLPGTVDEATVARLESLGGPEFDKLWLQSMIGQHQGAVELATTEIADGANVDAIAIAENIAAAQEARIAQMKQMLEGLP